MAAVVRVKRALDEEPISELVLSCKKRKKTDGSAEAAFKTLFTFAGTVKDTEQDGALLSSLKIAKPDVKQCSRPVPNPSRKVRVETKAASVDRRYKLVNYFRALGEENNDGGKEDPSPITVIDVEAQTKDDSKTKSTEGNVPEDTSTSEYVYDVYCIKSDESVLDVFSPFLYGMDSPPEHDFVFESFRNTYGGDSDSDSPVVDDDEDSNDENNWRNDYPDEEEGDNDEDDALASGFGKITVGDEELSSDGDDDGLIYTEQLSPSDVNMYGTAYASFKKRALRDLVDSSNEFDSEESLSSSTNSFEDVDD